jgi:hypothetical protein
LIEPFFRRISLELDFRHVDILLGIGILITPLDFEYLKENFVSTRA